MSQGLYVCGPSTARRRGASTRDRRHCKKRPGAQNKEALTPRRKKSTGNGRGALWVRDPVEWEHRFVGCFQLFWGAWTTTFNHRPFILKWAVSILEIEWSELDTKLGLLSYLTSISSCYSDGRGLYSEFSLRMKRIPEGGIRVFVLVYYYCCMNTILKGNSYLTLSLLRIIYHSCSSSLIPRIDSRVSNLNVKGCWESSASSQFSNEYFSLKTSKWAVNLSFNAQGNRINYEGTYLSDSKADSKET